MIKNLFFLWIVWQLVFIGFFGAKAWNKMAGYEIECDKPRQIKRMPEWWGVAVPLLFFMPDQNIYGDYCRLEKMP